MVTNETAQSDALVSAPSDSTVGGNKATAQVSNRTRFGIKVKLLWAFCTLAALTAIASAVAVYGFFLIDRSVMRITAESVPAMATSLQLAEKSAEIAAIAPTLMASSNQNERASEQANLEEKTWALIALTQSLNTSVMSPDTLIKLADIEKQIPEKLNELNAAVEERLRLKAQREASIADVTRTHGRFVEVIEPLVDDALFHLIISGEAVTAGSTKAITDLVEGGVNTILPLLVVSTESNLVAGLLAEAANVPDPALMEPIRERFVAAEATIERNLDQLIGLQASRRLAAAIRDLISVGGGNENIFDVRERELRAIGSARTALQVQREAMAEAVRDAHEVVLTTLAPIVDGATFDLVINAENLTAQSTKAINDLIDVGVNNLHALLTLRAEGNLAAGLLTEAAGVREPAILEPVRERFIAAVGHIQKMLEQLPKSMSDGTARQTADALIGFGQADDNIFDLRREELLQAATAQTALEASRSLAVQLVDTVAELVEDARRDSDTAALHSAQTINSGKWIMIWITTASLAGAAFIMLFYVAPRVIRPLENITTAMTELAAGDTSVDIPARKRGDEIGRMAQALGVFRDTAIEVQKSNLREIRDTRRRLTDAIESISEAFSLYDGEDRLVVCNSKYRTLLYPGIADEIRPGMTFESLVRRAAERGYIKDAENRIEEWLEQRLVRHREPGESHVQQRGDGRWILVSERKTEDGGTVAVYSDITELKQHEQQLSEKSNALEQLSNQLAKYLSPQVYESIFRGRQEVKVASRRKKLTVFFSDIVGFTETADRLESEDLSHLLNHYLTEMSKIALEYGATIDKYVGDAIVIFFGDPETRGTKEDALACVNMAIAMRKRMGELQAVWRESGIEKPLQCRTGISTGYCTVGNFGSEDRMDYTIIGGGVNLAARLEAAATPDEILISYETYAHVKDEIHCEEHGQISVRGIAYPVVTYQVVDCYANLGRDLDVIHEDQPNLKLDVNVGALSADERKQITTVLRQVLNRLTSAGVEHKRRGRARSGTD